MCYYYFIVIIILGTGGGKELQEELIQKSGMPGAISTILVSEMIYNPEIKKKL